MQIEIAGLAAETLEPKTPSDRPPILFIHGSGGGAWIWENFLTFFSARGYPAYAVNLRGGHGSGPADTGAISLRDHLKDLEAVLGEMQNPILFGHSLGALMVQKLAEGRRPPAVVAVSPAPPRGISPLNSPGRILRVIRHAPELFRSRPVVPTRAEAFRMTLNHIPVEDRERIYKKGLPQSGRILFELAFKGLPVDASKVQCPMLVAAGADDGLISPRTAEKVARKYRADFREYAGFGHMLPIEPGWEGVAKEIAQWLEGVIR